MHLYVVCMCVSMWYSCMWVWGMHVCDCVGGVFMWFRWGMCLCDCMVYMCRSMVFACMCYACLWVCAHGGQRTDTRWPALSLCSSLLGQGPTNTGTRLAPRKSQRRILLKTSVCLPEGLVTGTRGHIWVLGSKPGFLYLFSKFSFHQKPSLQHTLFSLFDPTRWTLLTDFFFNRKNRKLNFFVYKKSDIIPFTGVQLWHFSRTWLPTKFMLKHHVARL